MVKSPSAAINLDQFCSHLTVSMTQKKCTRYITVTPRDYEVEPVTVQGWLRNLGPESLHVIRGTPAPRCDMIERLWNIVDHLAQVCAFTASTIVVITALGTI